MTRLRGVSLSVSFSVMPLENRAGAGAGILFVMELGSIILLGIAPCAGIAKDTTSGIATSAISADMGGQLPVPGVAACIRTMGF